MRWGKRALQLWCRVRIIATLYFGFSHTTSQLPGWDFCRGSHHLGCCLPAGPCCVTLRWVAKEGQAPHPVPATKTGWKTKETRAGVLPLPRGAVLLLNPVSLSYCYSWSWNTFQQGARPSSDQGRRRRGGSSTMALPKDRAQWDTQMWDSDIQQLRVLATAANSKHPTCKHTYS